LGPVLFLIFINDLDNAISTNVLKFADDTKVYRVLVDNRLDGTQLQNDLDVLGNWAVKWQMKFNVEKCKVMHYGKRNIEFEYRNFTDILSKQWHPKKIWELSSPVI